MQYECSCRAQYSDHAEENVHYEYRVQTQVQRLHVEYGMHAATGSAFHQAHIYQQIKKSHKDKVQTQDMQNALTADGSHLNSHACLRHS